MVLQAASPVRDVRSFGIQDFTKKSTDRTEEVIQEISVGHFSDPQEKSAPNLSQRSISEGTLEKSEAMTLAETWKLFRPLVFMIGFSLLFLVLLGGAIAVGIFSSLPAALAFIPLLGACIGGVIKGYELFQSDEK